MISTHPEIAEHEWYDECFRVYETQYKLWHSVSKEGEELVTALSKNTCISMTRFYLKGRQEGFDKKTQKTYDGVVGGKL